jgi:hypothetical protein
MLAAFNTIMTALQPMNNQSQPYFIQTFYIGKPTATFSPTLPACAVWPDKPSPIESETVGQDMDFETFHIRFYVSGARGLLDPAETTPGIMTLMAMCDEVKLLLRADPTFNSQFVYSSIKDIDLDVNITGETNAFRQAEIIFETQTWRNWQI